VTKPPSVWTFWATCHTCGEKMETVVKGGHFRKGPDDATYEYVVSLERTDIEAHMLMHDLCSCQWHTVGTAETQIISGYRTPNPGCVVHGRTS
jgi:hypothetical protein